MFGTMFGDQTLVIASSGKAIGLSLRGRGRDNGQQQKQRTEIKKRGLRCTWNHLSLPSVLVARISLWE